MALRYNMRINQGETWELTIPLIPAVGSDVTDFTGYTAVGQVRANTGDTTVLYEWSAAHNNVSLAPQAVILNVPAAVSSAWTWRRGVYDLELTHPDAGSTVRIVEGWVYVTPETTRS